MQNRIDRLEGLVLSLMTNGAQSAGAAAASRTLSMSNSTGSLEYPHDVDVDPEAQKYSTSRGEGEDAESETDQVSQSLGMMKVFNNQSTYYGDAHWATILSDVSNYSCLIPGPLITRTYALQIAEVKNWFSEHHKQLEDQSRKVQESINGEDSSSGSTFLFSGAKIPEYPELLKSLPNRSITDKLVLRYFKSHDPALRKSQPRDILLF